VTDPQASVAPAAEASEVLHCFWHPNRETLVRCGRCERPICGQCQVRHPVGIRCRECGLARHDPLTSLAPRSAALAAGTAFAGSLVGGAIASFLGIFAIFAGVFAGGAIADATQRVAGMKYGNPILAMVVSGIVAGGIVGFTIVSLGGLGPGATLADLPRLLSGRSLPLLLYLVFAVGGAVGRLRL
jgi:hypothetical protein